MNDMKISEKHIYVWLDTQLIKSQEYLDVLNQLETCLKTFKTFYDSDACIDFITDTINSEVFLIFSNSAAQKLIPLIHDFEQIHSIFVFISNRRFTNLKWTENYTKIKKTFGDIKSVHEHFLPNVNHSFGLSIISHSDFDSNNVNRQHPSFMYFQLIKDILTATPYNENESDAKLDMINYCRKTFHGNKVYSEVIDEFESSYMSELAISWYTRESFIYKILNEALLETKPDVLYQLRYFLRDLDSEITKHSTSQHGNIEPKLTVYRGQRSSIDQIEKLKKNIGGFLSFNNFLSTSLDERIALNFIWGSDVGILFEIDIDRAIEKFSFINIEQIDYLHGENSEKEILFSMGTTFRIKQIQEENRSFYRVYLTLTDEVDQQLAQYTRQIRADTRSSHPFLSLLNVMLKLSQYNSIDDFVDIFNNTEQFLDNADLFTSIHTMFGLIYYHRGQLDKALKHHLESYNIDSKRFPSVHPKLAKQYNNIGMIHLEQGSYQQALNFEELALKCEQTSDEPNLSLIITFTENIAKIYNYQNKYDEAINTYKRIIELQRQVLGENHPAISETYNKMGSIFCEQEKFEEAASCHEIAVKMQENTKADPKASANALIATGNLFYSQAQYTDALIHFNRALEIQQTYLLPNDPSLARTYNYIGNAFREQNQHDESVKFYMKSLEIQQHSLAKDNPSIAASYHNISRAHVGLENWSEAIEYALKAVEQSKTFFSNNPMRCVSYTYYVGCIYLQQEEYEVALIYYKESLEIYNNSGSKDDSVLHGIYFKCAISYHNLNQYEDALIYYKQSLDIQLKILPDNSPHIATAYSNMAEAYSSLRLFDEAITLKNQAIDQLCKTLPYNHADVSKKRNELQMIRFHKMFSSNFNFDLKNL